MQAGRLTGSRLRGKDVHRDRTRLLAAVTPLFVFTDQHLNNPAEIAQEHAQSERHRGHHQKGQPKRSTGRPCVFWSGYGVEMLRPRQGHWYAKRT